MRSTRNCFPSQTNFVHYLFHTFISKWFRIFDSKIERRVKEVTSDDDTMSDTTLLSELALATHNQKECTDIMNAIWQRLEYKSSKDWKITYKVSRASHYICRRPILTHLIQTLCLVDYIIRHGSPTVLDTFTANIGPVFTQLTTYPPFYMDGEDKAVNGSL